MHDFASRGEGPLTPIRTPYPLKKVVEKEVERCKREAPPRHGRGRRNQLVPAVTNVTTTTLPRLHHLADRCYGHSFPTYYSNNKKNGTGLLDVFTREEADHGFLVQHIGAAPNHYRKFLLFRNALEFWRSHRRSIPEANRCFCETVRDREQNMRFDIDLSRNKWPPGVEFGQRYADRVMKVVGTVSR